MSYVGKWVFHSIGVVNENDEMVYLSAEDYLSSPMLYIDESDEESVAAELKERKQMIGGQIEVCEDGKLYMLMPLPDGVSKEEVEQAVKAGVIKLYDGMMTDEPKLWEEREGELWIQVGEDMSENGWAKISYDNEYLTFITTRYVKSN